MCAYCNTKDEEIERLRWRVQTLEQVVGLNEPLPPDWGLSPTQSVVVTVLMKRDYVSREVLMQLVYSEREDPPEERAIDHVVSRVRQRLAPHGIQIETLHGKGWRIPNEVKQRIGAPA